jgi:hypothetical protein
MPSSALGTPRGKAIKVTSHRRVLTVTIFHDRTDPILLIA